MRYNQLTNIWFDFMNNVYEEKKRIKRNESFPEKCLLSDLCHKVITQHKEGTGMNNWTLNIANESEKETLWWNLNVGVWQEEEGRRLGRLVLAGFLRSCIPRCSVLLRGGRPCIRCCSGSGDNPLCAAHTPAAAWKGGQLKIQKFQL